MSEGQSWKPKHNPWVIALTVTLATFMEVLDTSIANVALPHIAGGLSAGTEESTWVLTSYLVSNAVVLPVSGWLSDRFGRKRFYMTCVAIFTISSFLCGFAPTLPLLILFRVLQGAGGGGLAPSEQAILADTFEPQKRGMAFAVYGMAVVLAPAIGPTLGGFITDHYSWRWIFYINVPVGILSLILTARIVEDSPDQQRIREKASKTPVDFVGLVLIALGLAFLQVVLDKGQLEDWFGSTYITWFSIISALCLIVFVLWEWRQDHPILKIQLLRNRTFTVSFILMFALGAVLYGTTVLLPQYLQLFMGYTAEQAGITLSYGGVATLLLLPFVGRIISKVDARFLIAIGFGINAIALYHMTGIYPGMNFEHASMLRVYQALGFPFLFVPIQTIAYVGISLADNNQVSGMINLARNIGGSVGISAVTTLIARRGQAHQNFLVGHVDPSNSTFTQTLTHLEQALRGAGLSGYAATQQAYGRIYQSLSAQAQTLGYIDTFFILSITCLLMVPLVFLARKNKPGAASMGH
jgi:MFS transporter, DHA2 family, multidrug resistance protein